MPRIDYSALPNMTEAFEEAIAQATAPGGDRIIRLAPGRYQPAPGLWRKLKGSADNPFRIIGGPETIFDGGQRVEDFQAEANEVALATQKSGFPSLRPIASRGRLCLKNSCYVFLEGLRFIGCWPTAIALKRSHHVHILDCHFREGTFAIYVTGSDLARPSSHLFVERSTYVQDISVFSDPESAIGDTDLDSLRGIKEPGRLWRSIPWQHVHGNKKPVGPEEWRAYDGDFLRTSQLERDCVVSGCHVSHAFNAVHWFNTDPPSKRYNNRLRVDGCNFAFIRDNCIEPEGGCSGLWVFHNRFYNVYKTFSFEMTASENVYVFGNRVWTDSKPGLSGQDNRGGALFKLIEASDRPPPLSHGGHYIFHNSMYLRASYAKKGALWHFHHVNNAIEYLHDVVVDGMETSPKWSKSMFGYEVDANGSAQPAVDDAKANFHVDWNQLDVSFVGNVVYQKHYPDDLMREAGYPRPPGATPGARLSGVRAPPGFTSPDDGGFELGENAAAKGAAIDYIVPPAPGGVQWILRANSDAGAIVDGELIAPPAGFVPVSVDMD